MQRHVDKSVWEGFSPSSKVALHKIQADDETQPLGVFQSSRYKNTDEVSSITSQFSLASHPTVWWGIASAVFNPQNLLLSLSPAATPNSTLAAAASQQR